MSSNTPPTRLGVVTRSPAGTVDLSFASPSISGLSDNPNRALSMTLTLANSDPDPSASGSDDTSRQTTLLDPPLPSNTLPTPSSVSRPPPPHNVGHSTTATLKPPGYQFEMSRAIDGLVAVTTEMEYERYSRGFTYKKEYNHYTIPSCTRSFPGPSIPSQWTTYVHPEGMRYFHKRTRHISVLTEARIDEPDQLAEIEHYLTAITTFIKKNHVLGYLEMTSSRPSCTAAGTSDPAAGLNLGSTPDKPGPQILEEESEEGGQLLLVLELRASGRCGYYFVDHTHQCLFWLDPFDFSDLVDMVRIQHTSGLVGLQMKSHYWYHNELFPHLYQLTPENLSEIEDILTFAVGDVATSGSSSTINHDLETLKLMQAMVVGFQLKDPSMQAKSIGGAWFIFRLLTTFYRERFISLYGEKGARLTASQSIHHASSVNSSNSLFLSLLSPFMFLGPSVHAKRLKNLTLDSVVSKREWGKLRGRLVEEWRESVLYATVILTANVAFLTIQSVDEAGGPGRRTPAQRACDFSIVTSMGTIMWGLVLGREYRESMSTSFIANRSASRAGIEMLAIVYSFPYALLMWSTVAFFVAFCITWFGSGDRVLVILISAACGFVALLIVWGAAIKYEKEPYWGLSPRWARRAWGALHRWIRSKTESERKRNSTVSNATYTSEDKVEKG